jgi:hypothetical protein
VKLTLDDPDSQAVAKLLINMSPEQFEGIRSQVPAETLRVYEELRAKGITRESPTAPSSGVLPDRKFTPNTDNGTQ